MSHLLKSPFCVHPKSGRIGVPIDLDTVEDFDPTKVPNIQDIMEEINRFDSKAREQGLSIKDIPNIEKTSLKKYLQIFCKFIDGLDNSQSEEEDEINYLSDESIFDE